MSGRSIHNHKPSEGERVVVSVDAKGYDQILKKRLRLTPIEIERLMISQSELFASYETSRCLGGGLQVEVTDDEDNES